MIRSASPAAWLAVLALSSFSPQPAAAQTATLLRDIKENAGSSFSSRSLQGLTAAGGKLFFLADLWETGEEVWVSDGTSAGTGMLRDSCPGTCSRDPKLFGAVGGSMLWGESDGEGGTQLWASDGTRPGTVALTVAPMDLGRAVDSPEGYTAFLPGAFYFMSCHDRANGDCDLWRTEGVSAGAELVHAGPSSFGRLVPAGDRLFYFASDGGDPDLWTLSRTQPTPLRLHRFPSSASRPAAAVVAGGRLYFLAEEAEGEEIWTSDGTPAGTRQVTRMTAPKPFTQWLKAAGNRIYFVANEGAGGPELWRTDGTAESTVRLSSFQSPHPFREESDAWLAAVGDKVVFTVTGLSGSTQLWSSRGTPSTTVPLGPFCADCEPSNSRFVEAGGKAYFFMSADSRSNLWVTDGTSSGTHALLPACASERCAFGSPTPWKQGVLFSVVRSGERTLWFSDGTAAGLKQWVQLDEKEQPILRIADLDSTSYFLTSGAAGGNLWARDPGGPTRLAARLPRSRASSDPHSFLALGDRILFSARYDEYYYDQDLWTSLGTPETTFQIKRPDLALTAPTKLLRVGGLAYFQTFKNRHYNLWRTDGTEGGTFVVAHLQGPAPMAAFSGGLIFMDAGWIWRSDGTVAGTVKTGELPPELGTPRSLVEGPGGLYFLAFTEASLCHVWITDGSTAGTRCLPSSEDPDAAGPALEQDLAVLGSFVYHVGGDGGIWRTDGSALGLEEFTSSYPSDDVFGLTVLQGNLYYFRSSLSQDAVCLYGADGTPTGHKGLACFPYLTSFEKKSIRLAAADGKVFFAIDDGVHGKELWSTDGTLAGTSLVRDLVPGRKGSNPEGLTAAGGTVYFSAGDTVHGVELWRSDGTAAGTRLAQDLAPQAASSFPSDLTVAGDNLFFSADDGLTGREPWVLPLSGATACRATSTRLCLGGGRYAVDSTWRDHQGNEGLGHPVSLTADTGYFWFFDPSNVETVLKVLDGRGVNGHVWTFYGALSDVEYSLTVTDTETGLAHRYLNPPGQLASVGDTHSFGPLGASAASVTTVTRGASAPLPLLDRRVVARAATGSCAPGSNRLCLNGGRFSVEVAWKDFSGNTGTGQGVALTADTGYFWFFDAANVELVLKVLDGSAVNGHRWVFYGALSSVEYTVTVTDTETGEIKTYRNPSGSLASVADVEAF